MGDPDLADESQIVNYPWNDDLEIETYALFESIGAFLDKNE